MIFFSAADLSVVVLLGLAAAVLHAGLARNGAPWWVGALHGALGLVGLGALVFALQGPPRGVKMGAGGFGIVAAVLLGLALLAAIGPLRARLRRQPMPVIMIGLHATLAIMGFVVLIAYVSMPA